MGLLNSSDTIPKFKKNKPLRKKLNQPQNFFLIKKIKPFTEKKLR